MNKLYATALTAVLIAASATAQDPISNRPIKVKKDKIDPTLAVRHAPERTSSREVLWSNDFSDPSDWTMGSTTGHYWTIGTQGGQGAYTIGPIASTTAANGFAIYDSDNIGTNAPQNTWIQVAEAIDLSEEDLVVIQFEQFYREFNGSCFLETSTDGTTWTSRLINDIGGNVMTANPELAFFNVSDEIGGSSTAYFRFRYESNYADYSWMIDDVEIISLPQYDLIMDYGYLVQFGTDHPRMGGLEYHRVPQNQYGASLNIGAGVTNYGFGQQDNVQVLVTVLDGGGDVAMSQTIDVGTMEGGEVVDVEATLDISPLLPLGSYTCEFTLSSNNIAEDASPGNNSAVRYFESSDDLYTQDGLDLIPDDDLTLTSAGTNSFTDNTQDVRLFTYYQINEPTLVTGVEVYLANGTDPGSYFIGALYDTADIFLGIMDSPLVESDLRFITEDDFQTGRAFAEFLTPITLQPGGYYVSANMYQEDGNNLRILDDTTVPQPAWASALWTPVDDDEVYLYGGNGTAWAVRLSTDFGTGVQEVSTLPGVKMYPNPTDGQFRVEVENGGNLTVEVFNTLGELVKTSQFSGLSTELDLRGEAAGIYTVRVGDGANYHVQRVAVK